MKNRISLDVDGVIAHGLYVHIGEATREEYGALRAEAPTADLRELSAHYDLHCVTSRGWPEAQQDTEEWLGKTGVLPYLSGVHANVLLELDGVAFKRRVTAELGALYHVDDDPRVVEALRQPGGVTWGLLYENPRLPADAAWYERQGSHGVFGTWRGLTGFLLREARLREVR